MTFVVKTLEGIRGIVYVYVMILVMFLWFTYLALNVVSRFNLKTLSYGKFWEVQEFLSNLLGETHWNVALHIRKPWRHPKVSSP